MIPIWIYELRKRCGSRGRSSSAFLRSTEVQLLKISRVNWLGNSWESSTLCSTSTVEDQKTHLSFTSIKIMQVISPHRVSKCGPVVLPQLDTASPNSTRIQPFSHGNSSPHGTKRAPSPEPWHPWRVAHGQWMIVEWPENKICRRGACCFFLTTVAVGFYLSCNHQPPSYPSCADQVTTFGVVKSVA